MEAHVVIGANYGDEGKGTVVATLAKHSKGKTLNILTNGGSQRAHSILTEQGSFTFQHFGSGAPYGVDHYFGPHFIINPLTFVREWVQLKDKVKLGTIYRSAYCKWSTPWDIMANQIEEELRGSKAHGSCGLGIWCTTVRYETFPCIPLDEFIVLDEDAQKNYLKLIKEYFEHKASTNWSLVPKQWKDLWDSPELVDHFLDDCKLFCSLTVVKEPLEFMKGYDNLIFENGQGLLLSDTGKDIAGTTPSLCGSQEAKFIMNQLGLNTSDLIGHYVTRPYLTKHGKDNYWFGKSRATISSSITEDRTNHYNQFQGKFRYDELPLLNFKARILLDGINPSHRVIDLTHCDEMDRVKEFQDLGFQVVTYDSPLIK